MSKDLSEDLSELTDSPSVILVKDSTPSLVVVSSDSEEESMTLSSSAMQEEFSNTSCEESFRSTRDSSKLVQEESSGLSSLGQEDTPGSSLSRLEETRSSTDWSFSTQEETPCSGIVKLELEETSASSLSRQEESRGSTFWSISTQEETPCSGISKIKLEKTSASSLSRQEISGGSSILSQGVSLLSSRSTPHVPEPLRFVNTMPRGKHFRRSKSVGFLNYSFDSFTYTGPIGSIDRNRRRSETTSEEILENESFVSDVAPSREPLNQYPLMSRRTGSVDDLSRRHSRFISTAEAVYKFHKATPSRYRSQPKLATFKSNPSLRHLHGTVPKSPMLKTKERSRPCLNVVSREAREQMEFDNIQKMKFRAAPFNRNILYGPLRGVPVERRPVTRPEPFNLTRPVPKKVVPERRFVFHAQPVPKSSQHVPLLPEVPRRPITSAKTPTFMKNYKARELTGNKSEKEMISCADGSTRPKKTIPEPFSFEVRDKTNLKKKEELIKKMIDEEKQARQFHANPIPKAVLKKGSSSKSGSTSSLSSERKHPSSDNLCRQFKAREATVLTKEPFIPTISGKELTNPEPFQLESELRSAERKEYDMKMKMREEEIERQRQLIKELQEQKEEAERERNRALAQYKAQPIRKYKPVEIVPSRQVTQPVTPFRKRQMYGNMLDNNDKYGKEDEEDDKENEDEDKEN